MKILPSQMFPMALVCGNTMVLKPSERNPGAVMFIMKLAQEAGIPDGCVNVFHGTIERMCPLSLPVCPFDFQVKFYTLFFLTTTLFPFSVEYFLIKPFTYCYFTLIM